MPLPRNHAIARLAWLLGALGALTAAQPWHAHADSSADSVARAHHRHELESFLDQWIRCGDREQCGLPHLVYAWCSVDDPGDLG